MDCSYLKIYYEMKQDLYTNIKKQYQKLAHRSTGGSNNTPITAKQHWRQRNERISSAHSEI